MAISGNRIPYPQPAFQPGQMPTATFNAPASGNTTANTAPRAPYPSMPTYPPQPMMPQGGYPGYGYWQPPMMPYMPPGMTLMPVIRTVNPQQQPAANDNPRPAAVEKTTPQAEDATFADGLAETPATVKPIAKPKATRPAPSPLEEEALDEFSPSAKAKSQPLTPAQRTGQKVGETVSRLLEDYPQFQPQAEALLNRAMASPVEYGDRIRASVQSSRLFRMTPRWVDRRITSMFPREMEPVVEQAFEWLRTKPANAPPARQARREKAVSDLSWMDEEPRSVRRGKASSPFETDFDRVAARPHTHAGKGKASRKDSESSASIEELLRSLGAERV